MSVCQAHRPLSAIAFVAGVSLIRCDGTAQRSGLLSFPAVRSMILTTRRARL